MDSFVEVHRGSFVESRHKVHAVVVRPDGTAVAHTGDPALVTFWRSAAKFFQAAPLVATGAADALGLGEEELAIACASHNGEVRHVDVAGRLLARSDSSVDDLHCGAHPSLNEDLARMQMCGEEPLSRLQSNCSGKHAGMLALASHNKWSKSGYEKAEHPVQRAVRGEVATWTGVAEPKVGAAIDGCGVPTWALPLGGMALAYARIAAAATGASNGPVPERSKAAVTRLVKAVQAHPFLIAGTGRLDTELIEATGGKIVAKVGASGVYCAALLEPRLGLALKVEDGNTRALAPALMGLLDALLPGAVGGGGLDRWRRQEVHNSNGVAVGEIRARVELVNGAKK